MPLIGSQWFLTRTGDCATNSLESGGFIRSEEGIPHPNIQIHFLPFAVKDHGRVFPDGHAYQVKHYYELLINWSCCEYFEISFGMLSLI